MHYPSNPSSHRYARITLIVTIFGMVTSIFHPDIREFIISLITDYSPPVEIASFKPHPPIIAAGDRANLEWQTLNADKCLITWIDRKKLIERKVEPNSSMHVNPRVTTKYVLTCSGTQDKSEKDVSLYVAKAPSPLDTYVNKINYLQEELDCDNRNDNAMKALLFRDRCDKRRVKLQKEILSVNARDREIYLTEDWVDTIGSVPNGIGPVHIGFNRSPRLLPRTDLLLTKVKPRDNPMFDCQINNYCEDGILWDGHITLDDCYIEDLESRS